MCMPMSALTQSTKTSLIPRARHILLLVMAAIAKGMQVATNIHHYGLLSAMELPLDMGSSHWLTTLTCCGSGWSMMLLEHQPFQRKQLRAGLIGTSSLGQN